MTQELSRWFGPVEPKPSIDGVYETHYYDKHSKRHKGFSMCRGGKWGEQRSTVLAASAAPYAGERRQLRSWRGLAQKVW